jgi:hypothetical protein
MKKRLKVVASMAMLVVMGLGTAQFSIEHARASGIPPTGAMTYSGILEDPNGNPQSGTRVLQIQLWDAATGGTSQCSVGPSSQELVGGRFQITLSDACTSAVKAKQNLWIEIVMDGVSAGRTKLGAVPYAVEADHAVNASIAVGALDARLVKLENDLTALTSKALTAADAKLASTSDTFAPQCFASPNNAADCGAMCSRVCKNAGYRSGWYEGESNGAPAPTPRYCRCVK